MDKIGSSELVLHRTLEAPIERVWSFIVDPELRARWFMSGPSDLRPGGHLGLTMKHHELSDQTVPTPPPYQSAIGSSWAETVTLFEPPHAVGFTWDGGRGGKLPFVSMPKVKAAPNSLSSIRDCEVMLMRSTLAAGGTLTLQHWSFGYVIAPSPTSGIC